MYQNIKPISKESYNVLSYLADAARQDRRGYAKIRNSDTYTPVTVEILFSTEKYEQVSVCHYGEQNGDLMADPEMVFYHDREEHVAYPGYYLNHFAGVEQEAIRYDQTGKPAGVCRSLQVGMVDFANIWMKNINEQQEHNL